MPIGIALSLLFTVLADGGSMVLMKNGFYQPLYLEPPSDKKPKEYNSKFKADERISVNAFLLDRYPVTRRDFQNFLKTHPEWEKTKIKKIYAESTYLKNWESESASQSPVTYVSWFAARAYCKALGKRLPTLAEWEYAGAAYKKMKSIPQTILDWYSRPTPKTLPDIGSTFANDFGVYDLHGLIWEWVEDFNSSLVTGESRADSSLDRGAFCGAGSLNSSNFKDYAAFMRFGFRSSLNGSFALGNLGFRCAMNLREKLP